MERCYSITCDGERAKHIETLAREYDLTTEEVLDQLLSIGLEEIDGRTCE